MNNYNSNNHNLRKEIVEKADIVSIISSYVNLEKKGANYLGLCPFHEDKNPSMSVSPTKRVFKCFSCNTGGDVITFVSKIKNISQRDAMREIGASVGINVNLTQHEIDFQKNKKYYELMNEASSFYSFYLRHADDAKKGLEYLHNRGLNDFIIQKFNIGLASEHDEIYKLLLSKNYLPIDMLEVGIVRSTSNGYKDTFNNRIIFPISDLDGNICGFSGRRYLDGDKDSKYINTNETIIFKKGQILYNYHNAISEIKANNKVFLFEGFMDVIAAVRSGINNSVASMGTALTRDQIQALKRITNNIVLCYDSDDAGIIATLRAIDLIIPFGINISVVSIPDGKDPDEYIKKNGETALFNWLKDEQISAMDFIYNYYYKSTNFENISEKENFKNIIFKNLKNFKSNVIIESFIKKLSHDIDVSVDALIQDFQIFQNMNSKKEVLFSSLEENNSDIKTINKKIQDKPYYERKKYANIEKQLIYAAYTDKNRCLTIESKLNTKYVLDVNRDLLFKLLEFYQKREIMNEEEFFKKLTNEEKDALNEIIEFHKIDNFDCILEMVEEISKFPIEKSIQEDANNGKEKTAEDLQELANKKRLIIKRNTRKRI